MTSSLAFKDLLSGVSNTKQIFVFIVFMRVYSTLHIRMDLRGQFVFLGVVTWPGCA